MAVPKIDLPNNGVAKKNPPPVPSSSAPKMQVHERKNFTVAKWHGENDGEKIIIHADSGMGKTTLASMAPKPLFIGLDDGGRKIRNPKTGEPLTVIEGVSTFQDVLDVFSDHTLFDDYETGVLDTITLTETLAIDWILQNVAGPKGKRMSNIVEYGYNKGYTHLYEAMDKLTPLFDALVRRGKNIILIAQSANHKVANAGGEDFLREGPRLSSSSNANIEARFCEWADHILRLAYLNVVVDERKVIGDNTRAVFTDGEAYFRAKSRDEEIRKVKTISFETPEDDSIWKWVFRKDA
jgi:hypothetical protein